MLAGQVPYRRNPTKASIGFKAFRHPLPCQTDSDCTVSLALFSGDSIGIIQHGFEGRSWVMPLPTSVSAGLADISRLLTLAQKRKRTDVSQEVSYESRHFMMLARAIGNDNRICHNDSHCAQTTESEMIIASPSFVQTSTPFSVEHPLQA